MTQGASSYSLIEGKLHRRCFYDLCTNSSKAMNATISRPNISAPWISPRKPWKKVITGQLWLKMQRNLWKMWLVSSPCQRPHRATDQTDCSLFPVAVRLVGNRFTWIFPNLPRPGQVLHCSGWLLHKMGGGWAPWKDHGEEHYEVLPKVHHGSSWHSLSSRYWQRHCYNQILDSKLATRTRQQVILMKPESHSKKEMFERKSDSITHIQFRRGFWSEDW